MESNNQRPTKPEPDQPPNKMGVGDWRSKLSPESREKVINKIMETLNKYYPNLSQSPELCTMAGKFEEKIYQVAADQDDYLKRISLKLLAMDSKAQNAASGSSATNTASGSRNHLGSVPQNMQVQRNNQGQAVLMPSDQPEVLQPMLAPDLPNIASAGVHNSAGSASTLPPVSGMNQSPISNLMNSSNMQGMADASQNGIVNTMGKGVAKSVFNSQKEVQGCQRVTLGHQQFQKQQPQKSVKQKQLQQGIIPDYLMQTPIQQQQQQHLPQPNQMQSLQQAGNSTSNAVLQQHSHTMLRIQQHPQQTPERHQQQVAHQSTRSSQPQQQLQTSQTLQSVMDHRTNTTNMQPTQPFGQQNMSEMLQHNQRLIGQQNSISNLQQQQLIAPQHMGHQGNVSRLQQQLHGTRSSNSDMQPNQHQTQLVHQNKWPVSQQNQQAATSLPLIQGHHSQPAQLHITSQIKSESAQLQQHLGMNQQQQRDVHQRHKPSGTLMQSHNIGDQQKQMYQSVSVDSVSHTGHASSVNWQEEIHKKITSLKGIYFDDLHILYLKVSRRIEQLRSLPQQSNKDQFEKLNAFKLRLKGLLTYLLVEKSNVTPAHGEKMPNYEKLIVSMLNAHGPRRPEHVTPPIHHTQSHENHFNPSPQSDNIQGPVMMEQNNTSVQQNSVSSLSRVANAQVNMIGTLKPEPNVEAGQGSRLASLQQGIGGSLQQNSVNGPQQTDLNALSMQNGGSLVQSNISNLQSMSNVNQQHVKEQRTMQSQHHKHKYQQRHQQMVQKQQQLHQLSKHQRQAGLLPAHQVLQIQQMEKMNDVNLRQGLGVNTGDFSQHVAPAVGQHSVYHQLKSGVSFPMSSLQMLQSTSPRMLQKSSPQVDQQNMLPSVSKTGTPLPSANFPFTMPLSSNPLAPSPKQGDPGKLASNISPITITGNIGVHQSAPTQLLAIETSGVSASPLLAEVSNQDGATSASVTKSSITEEPLDRLIKAVKSISNEALSASVNDILSVVSLINRIAGSAPGNGSRAAVGEDLAAMTKCRVQAKNLGILDKGNGSKKMKRCTSSVPLVVVATNGSWEDNFTQHFDSELSDLESTATSRAKRPRTEVNHSLLKEIRDINQRLINTMVDISEEDENPCTAAEVASESGEGVIVKCSYNAVAISLDLKYQYASPQMSPIQPLRLLVPSNYPNCSPVLLDTPPVNISDDTEDLSTKAKSKFSRSLRTLTQPMSLKEIARTWDVCARAVISEYAQARGGGSFSSTYGSWESVF